MHANMSHADCCSLSLLLVGLILDHILTSSPVPATHDLYFSFPSHLLPLLTGTASPSAGIDNSDRPQKLTSWHRELLQVRSFPTRKCPDFARRLNSSFLTLVDFPNPGA